MAITDEEFNRICPKERIDEIANIVWWGKTGIPVQETKIKLRKLIESGISFFDIKKVVEEFCS